MKQFNFLRKIILDKEKLIEWIKRFQLNKRVSFVIITNFEEIPFEIVGINLFNGSESIYFPLGHNYPDVPNQLCMKDVLSKIQLIFLDKNIRKITKNLKLDYLIMSNYGIDLKNNFFDIELASYVSDNISGSYKHDLKSLTKRYDVIQNDSILDKIDTNKNQIDLKKMKIEEASIYSSVIAKVMLSLYDIFWSNLKRDQKLLNIFQEIEIPLAPILAKMEKNGVLIDLERLLKFSFRSKRKLSKIKDQVFQITKKNMDLTSIFQIRKLLFEEMELPILKRNKDHSACINEEILKKLSCFHSLPSLILKYRSLYKLRKNYCEKIFKMINKKTNRVHTSYFQSVVSTGRLSSRNPNLQNIPIKNKEGREIRRFFTASDGFQIVSLDYSQIELRVLAHCSKDENLIRLFKKDQDVHIITAQEIFEIKKDKISTVHRRIAKMVNFGLIYGITPMGLSNRLGISLEKAKDYMNLYFKKYPSALLLIKKIKQFVKLYGYIDTLNGRKIYFQRKDKSFSKRNILKEAVNAFIQGTSADIVKMAMIKIDDWIENHSKHVRMLLQIHDELIFEIKDTLSSKYSRSIKEMMENVIKLSVPLKVNVKIGKNLCDIQ
ncbi:DNA polymerase [Candidatus Riesia pediculicola]|uniref:DNA polymerase n=1 Tax=Candidatus Riesia pediculicola TaxID=401619 RepID=UPI0012DB7B00|nr:DNA polymerase [Candidatus Riesia pediculicola]